MQRWQVLGQILASEGGARGEKSEGVRRLESGNAHAPDPDTEDAARRHPPVPAHGQGGLRHHTHREAGGCEAGAGPAGVAG